MSRSTGVWTRDEHDQFLDAIKMHPQGPWREIAECVPTRSLRQVQTHAQKYHEKVVRRMRGLRKDRRNAVERGEHRIDAAMLEVCRLGEGFGAVRPGRVQSREALLSLSTLPPLLSSSSQRIGSQVDASIAATGADTAIDEIDTVVFTAELRSRRTRLERADELPSLGESLDFLLEHLAAETFDSGSSNNNDDCLDVDMDDNNDDDADEYDQSSHDDAIDACVV